MGCNIIVGKDDSGDGVGCACFYDSVTDTVFGVKMNDLEEAEAFHEYCKIDLRRLSHKEFVDLLNKFRDKREKENFKNEAFKKTALKISQAGEEKKSREKILEEEADECDRIKYGTEIEPEEFEDEFHGRDPDEENAREREKDKKEADKEFDKSR